MTRDHRARGRDFLTGRCGCSTCERAAAAAYPAAYADWCHDRGVPVPDQVAAALDRPAAWRPPWALLGVDLGRRTDHSAVALLVPGGPADTAAGVRWRVPSVTRLPLSTGTGGHYAGQARRLAAAVTQTLGQVAGPVTVLVDATGVGDAVTEMISDALPADRRVRLIPVVITGGRSARLTGQRWSVSKVALVGPTLAALEQAEIKFGGFEGAELLRRELLAYRIKPSSVEGGPEKLEAARQSDHDDMVIAVALPVLAARRQQPLRIRSPARPGRASSPALSLYRRRLR